ncbi:glycosyltransferase family 4 protein [Flavobacterium sp.]|uniref:glycosyltransferase family 4 protein n=1 Tax=Flavobacterium sp. TaxID=239 RepID=UPI003918DD57
MMKIAFLTTEYPHAKTGFSAGIGTSIMNLGKGLLQLGHQVTIVIYGQDKDETFFDNGFTFYKIKNKKLKGFSRILTQKKIEKLINDLVVKGEIDVVEAADWTGITSNINLKCPLVIKLHGSDTYFCHLDQRPVKFLNRFREKKALQKANAWLSVSQYTATVTKELFALSNDFTVIPNGIDLADFSVAEMKNTAAENTILYFGTLIRKKGSLELPLIFNEVFKQNKQAKLILIGRDAADITTGNSSVWAMMQPLFDTAAFQNVTFLGSVPYDQMKTHINASTVCVFPTFAEALPVSWIEAMAMQKAIVASDIGWAKEVIDDDVNGFLVNPKEHQVFAKKINILLENTSLRSQIGAAAKAKVQQKFSIEVVAQQSAAFYQKLIR